MKKKKLVFYLAKDGIITSKQWSFVPSGLDTKSSIEYTGIVLFFIAIYT